MTGHHHGLAPVLSNQTPNSANPVNNSTGAHSAHLYSLSTCEIITQYIDGAGVCFTWFSYKPRPWETSRSRSDVTGTGGDEKRFGCVVLEGFRSDVREVGVKQEWRTLLWNQRGCW